MANTKASEIAFINNQSSNTFISLVSFGKSPSTSPSGPFASTDTINLWNQQKVDHLPHFQAYAGAPMDTNMVPPNDWYPNCNPTTECPNVSILHAPYSYLNPDPDAMIDTDFTDSSHKSTLTNKVNSYTDWGGTNYASGINAALQEFASKGTAGHTKTIIIMGDGINMMAPIAPGSLESYWPSDWYPRSNLGWMDESDAGKLAAVDAANRAKAEGITVYAIGFCTPIGAGCYQDSAQP